MTLLMRDKENKKLGKYETMVEAIKNGTIKGVSVDDLSGILGTSKELVSAVLDCVANHPDWDDEDVADWLIQEYE